MNYNLYITPEQYDTAAKNGINKKALETRYRICNWDIEKAITYPLRTKDEENIRWSKIAEENGIEKSIFYGRVNTYKWDRERAATTPVKRKKRRDKDGQDRKAY